MRRAPLLITSLGIAALLLSAAVPVRERMIWNRTPSLPEGLYWRSDDAFGRGDIVALSAKSEAAQWAARHGFTGPDWPLLKAVAGVPGDVICRHGAVIWINETRAGRALYSAENGVLLPRWEGCRRLTAGEVFLMNTHPRSLDGRYFGVTQAPEIEGRAILVFPAGGVG